MLAALPGPSGAEPAVPLSHSSAGMGLRSVMGPHCKGKLCGPAEPQPCPKPWLDSKDEGT